MYKVNLKNNSNAVNTKVKGSLSFNNATVPNLSWILLDNNGNYRYYGMDPNNYVYFNCEDYSNQSSSTCELWRIIGTFTNVDDGTGKLETRVKIIRETSIGDYSYDTSSSSINSGQGTNDWLHTDSNIEWLISPHNEPRYRPFTLQNGKYIFGAYSYHGYEVRPTLYLNSDVHIMNGEGTEINPYQLNS